MTSVNTLNSHVLVFFAFYWPVVPPAVSCLWISPALIGHFIPLGLHSYISLTYHVTLSVWLTSTLRMKAVHSFES